MGSTSRSAVIDVTGLLGVDRAASAVTEGCLSRLWLLRYTVVGVVGGIDGEGSAVQRAPSRRPEHPPYPTVTMTGPYEEATVAQEQHAAAH